MSTPQGRGSGRGRGEPVAGSGRGGGRGTPAGGQSARPARPARPVTATAAATTEGAPARPTRPRPAPAGAQPAPTQAAPAEAAPPADRAGMTRQELSREIQNRMPKAPAADPATDAKLAPKTCNVYTNYFPISTNIPTVYQYDVSFQPPLDSAKIRYGMLHSHAAVLGETMSFDGMQLFLTVRMPEKITYFKTKRSKDNQEFEITVKLTNELAPKQCFQLYNIIFRKVLRLMNLKQIGRHYFDSSTPSQVPQHNMELWPGYVTAIAEYDCGPCLNIDMATKVLRTDTAMDHIYKLKKSTRPEQVKDVLVEYFSGQVVLTRYGEKKSKNATYKIDGVAHDLTPKSTFQTKTGPISYVDYFMQAHKQSIKDLNQPLFIHKTKKFRGNQGGQATEETIYLVPELCYMTGYTDEVRSNFTIMRDISKYTIVPPDTRKLKLEKFIKDMYANEDVGKELANWKIQFDKSLLKIQARVFGTEQIHFKGKTVSAGPKADWGRDIKGVNMVSAPECDKWAIVFSSKAAPQARDFMTTLQKVGPGLGIKVAPPKEVTFQRDDATSYVNALKDLPRDQIKFVVCILPDNRKDRYDMVKKYCVADTGMISQCMLSKVLSNPKVMTSAVTKVAMQICTKLGGELWYVDVPMKNIMVVGLDVYHDSLQKGTSVVGFIASMNNRITRYYSRVFFQRSGQELVDGMRRCLGDSLKKWAEVNGGAYPQRIIIYRDGVGDGQLNDVMAHEVPQVQLTFKDFGDYNPQLTFVVVKKRISTRMMYEDRGKIANPLPGTLIKTHCTGKNSYDYFICAQAVGQGTATPTNYHVIFDSSTIHPMHLQTLTFKLTHLYYNWPGTVRVPAPCQYAHKIAFLVGQSVHKDPQLNLADKLYFL